MLFFVRLFFLLIFLFANTNGTTETAKAQSTPPAKKKLKILVYSVVPAHSHMQFMGAIADSLAEAGHEVHFIKTISDELQWVTKVESNETKLSSRVYRVVLKSRGAPVATSDVLYPFKIAFRRELLDELAKERYDVAIYELFDLCGAAIFERIGVRTKLATLTMPMQQISAAHFGIPTFASFVPNWAHPPLNAPTMDFWERLINFLNTFYDWYKLNDRVTDLQSPLVREAFGADFPKTVAIKQRGLFEEINKMLNIHISGGVHTFRLLDISPTDISPTDISPTKPKTFISPTKQKTFISPTKPKTFISPTKTKTSISPTRHFAY
ncbi:hypothetical protein niasHT_033286 [Heterodera trifolii]|uniref:glucuronosyltransferase n=1 Tax=Heterodera trifolii TaxID=157864 RepID=A0ABD2ID52_9BILA